MGNPFCESEDSAEHRHWHCPFFQDVRDAHQEIVALAPDLPESTRNHAWLMRLPSQAQYLEALTTLPDCTGVFYTPQLSLPTQHLFTDGSCVHPTQPVYRLASWATVIWDGEDFVPLSSGFVPGWQQTSLRAELWAAISALKCAASRQVPTALWIDNDAVCTTLQQWLTHHEVDTDQRADSDLWYLLKWQFRYAAPFLRHVFKVVSHGDHTDQATALDAWATLGNKAADTLAAAALQHLPPTTKQLWDQVKQEHTEALRIGHLLYAHLVAIGKKAIQARTIQEAPPPAGVEDVQAQLECDPMLLAVATAPQDQVPSLYHIAELPTIQAWLASLTDTTKPLVWVSFHQLLLHYQHHTQSIGPVKVGKKWKAGADCPHRDYVHSERTQGFANFICRLARSMDMGFTVQQRRPPSEVLAFWGGHLAVHVSYEELHQIDDHLKLHLLTMPARQVRHTNNVQPFVAEAG
eukprot:Skav221588  [mRNA]  locus=scaffold1698:145799:147190:+ [translate_table: standard]